MIPTDKPLWTILVPTIPERVGTHFLDLMGVLQEQIGPRAIQVIGLFDNYSWRVGQKRNHLLRLVDGDFFSFVDDDDEISDHYIDSIWSTIVQRPDSDVIVFQQMTDIGGGGHHLCEYGLDKEYWMSADRKRWTGKPAHTMVWRTACVGHVQFPVADCGEDVAWVKQACALARVETRIDDVLYYYHYDPARTRTRAENNTRV